MPLVTCDSRAKDTIVFPKTSMSSEEFEKTIDTCNSVKQNYLRIPSERKIPPEIETIDKDVDQDVNRH